MKHPSQLNLDWHNPRNVPLQEGFRFALEEEKKDVLAGKVPWHTVSSKNGAPSNSEPNNGFWGCPDLWDEWSVITKEPLPEKYFHMLLEPGDIEVGDEIVCIAWGGSNFNFGMIEVVGTRMKVTILYTSGTFSAAGWTWPIESIVALHKKQPTREEGDAKCQQPSIVTTHTADAISVGNSPASTSDPSGEGQIEPWMDSLAGEVSEALIVDQPLHKVKLDVISMIMQHYRSRDEGPKSTLLPFDLDVALKQPALPRLS